MPELQSSAVNGAVSSADVVEPQFPVESFREAAPHLRRPFTGAAVRFKVQATFGGDPPTSALIVAYIDARLVTERLNLVCPHLWSDEYESLGKSLVCALTIDGITRRDLGSGYEGKGLYSDAFKRAAVKFGVGVSLYAVPQMFLKVSDNHLKVKGKTVTLTPNGETRCRDLYTAWLAQTGQQTFGEPLDHGDTADSVGDVESQTVNADDPTGTIGQASAKELVDRAWIIPEVKSKFALAIASLTGDDPGDCSTKAKAATAAASLTVEQADKLSERIAAKGAESNG